MLSLALAFIQDPSTPQQINPNTAAGIGIAAILFFILIGFAVVAFVIFMLWRVFTKAGFPGPLAFLALLGPIGVFICVCVLAFGDWKVVPIATAASVPPPYQPPPSYMPPSYPPTQPPAA
jgi:hypothetical protein